MGVTAATSRTAGDNATMTATDLGLTERLGWCDRASNVAEVVSASPVVLACIDN